MKVHAAIAKALAEHGVDTMFGVIGDANLFMADSFARDQRGRYVAAANEAGAVLMANGYACTTGRVGVATVTHGPALTNTMTSLVEGVKGRTPIVLVAGDTPVEDKHNLQNVAQRDFVVATGAGFEQMRSARSVVDDVAAAMRRAVVERRPIVLNVPIELQWEDVEYRRAEVSPPEPQAVAPDPSALDRAVGIIASAQRPIVVAGRGAARPAARAALLRLAERLNAPVATTLKAKDLFRGEPFDLGIFGTLSTPVAAETILGSDCILAFGAGLNKWTTAEGSYLEGRRVVHCDIDLGRIGDLSRTDAAVVGDATVVADTIVSWLDELDARSPGLRSDGLARQLSEYSAVYGDHSTDYSVDVRTALRVVDVVVPHERTLVTDGGRFVFEAWGNLHVSDPRSFVFTVNSGSIGLGMGNAIGAFFGIPGRPVLLVTGDGGFMLGGLTEFNTAVRNNVDLIVAVCNDGSYGAEYIQFRDRGMDPSLSTFAWPDLAPVAEALGGRGITVRNVKDLDGLADAVANRDRPLLIDIKIDPDYVPMLGH